MLRFICRHCKKVKRVQNSKGSLAKYNILIKETRYSGTCLNCRAKRSEARHA